MHKNVWICIEKAEGNYSAYAPAVLGCVSTGKTVEETRLNMAEALGFHFEGMIEDGESIEAISEDFPAEVAARSKGDGEEDYFSVVQVRLPERVNA